MAIISPGPIGEISGRLGGIEFARTRYGTVLKRQKTHHSRQTEATVRAQATQAAIKKYWDAQDESYHVQWEAAARQRTEKDRFGRPRKITGYQLFLGLPHDYKYCSSALVLPVVPPFQGMQVTWGDLTVFSSQVFVVVADFPKFLSVNWMTAWVSRWCSNTSDARPSTWKWMGTVESEDTWFVFNPVLEDMKIRFQVGERLFVRVQAYNHWSWPVDYEYGFYTVTE